MGGSDQLQAEYLAECAKRDRNAGIIDNTTVDPLKTAEKREREACANLVRNWPPKPGVQQDTPFEREVVPPPDLNEIADAILARGK